MPDNITGPMKGKKKTGASLELGFGVKALSETLGLFDKAYLCIDALDECTEEHRGKLISCLTQLVTASHTTPAVKLFFTGRPQMKGYVESHPDIGLQAPPVCDVGS
jgi:hypothetical protein